MELIVMFSIPVVVLVSLFVVDFTTTKEEKAVINFMSNRKLFVLPYPNTSKFAKANYEYLKKYHYI